MDELVYDPEAQDPRWAAQVEGWPWTQRDRWTYEKKGPCPRCGHPTTLQLVQSASMVGGGRVTETKGLGRPRPPLPQATEFRCLCSHPHAKDRVGCGLVIRGISGPGRP